MGNGLTHAAVATITNDGVSELEKEEWNDKHVVQTLELTGVITPAAITGATNDYAPTGAAGASVWRISSTGSFNLTGIAAATDGTVLIIQNVGSNNIWLKHEDTGSAAANRMRLPSGSTAALARLLLPQNGLPAMLVYNAVAQRWDVLSAYPPANSPASSWVFTGGASIQLVASSNYQTNQYGIYADTGQLVLYVNGGQGAENQHLVANASGQLIYRDGITPTIPTVASVGAEFTSTAAPTATLPAGQAANDILVLLLQSSNENIATPVGYTKFGPQNGHGASVTAGSTRGASFWKRSTGGGESAPTIADSGDHTYGVMLAIRGCPTTGDPFHFLSNSVKRVASTAAVLPGGVTSVDECLILQIAWHAVDNASGQAGAATNADLASITESFDDGTTDGTGGGITVISSRKALAGPFGNTTFTWANSTVEVCSTIAFLPVNANLYRQTRAPEVQTFYGSTPGIADSWVKATGATRVQVEAIGGGGSGGAGRNAATAEGGGAGGGGMFQQKWFTARELAASVTLTPGPGGAATANTDGTNGNNGTSSTFGTAPVLITAVGGRGGVGAITADGGDGGAGGGIDTPAAGTVQTVGGALAGRGGNGTTAPVAGSSSDWGGGGGESGADTDAGSTPGGSSQYGGGGGSSGRAAGTVSSAGAGGGAVSPTATAGTTGNDSAVLPLGGSGGIGGTSAAGPGGQGGFPGGGAGGGGTQSAAQRGGAGGHGCVVVTSYFS